MVSIDTIEGRTVKFNLQNGCQMRLYICRRMNPSGSSIFLTSFYSQIWPQSNESIRRSKILNFLWIQPPKWRSNGVNWHHSNAVESLWPYTAQFNLHFGGWIWPFNLVGPLDRNRIWHQCCHFRVTPCRHILFWDTLVFHACVLCINTFLIKVECILACCSRKVVNYI